MTGVRKRFGRRELWAPNPLDLEVQAGETVALLGANGAGKSTLLRLAATVGRPSAGRIAIQGVDALAAPAAARAHLGYQPQDAPLYAELTPSEHLRWWARLHGAAVDADGLLVANGLAAVAHAPAATLSRGQRQRVALALATLHDPALLLLDEPFTALDADGARRVEELLDDRSGRKATLFALHDAAQAHHLADRVLRLDRDGLRDVRA
jgi:ABC-type multidrug transport system ATPase subunit